MRNASYYLVVFNSKNHAYFLESLLRKMGYSTSLVQAPKYLTNNCNMAIVIDEEALETVREKIRTHRLAVYKIYKHYIEGYKRIYREVKKS